MSDDWIEDGIRDNAGHLALAGALMAHSQRRQEEASRKRGTIQRKKTSLADRPDLRLIIS